MLFKRKFWRASESSVEVALVVGLGGLKFGVRLLVEDIQLVEELASKGNWFWQLGHIVWDGAGWM